MLFWFKIKFWTLCASFFNDSGIEVKPLLTHSAVYFPADHLQIQFGVVVQGWKKNVIDLINSFFQYNY